jgi:endonuclease III
VNQGRLNLRHGTAHSGSIWNEPVRRRNVIIRNVCRSLKRAYGTPRLGNPSDPLDDLVFITLSNKTGPRTARRVYNDLSKKFSNWDQLLVAPISEVRRTLRPAGLSTVKARQLRGALRMIKNRFGVCDLTQLKDQPEQEVEAFLVRLPGVSEKVAKCIMMYTLTLKVLPVDVHVHRISMRLGWTKRKRADQCHEELESLVPPNLRYGFHVDCIVHGREACRPQAPLCSNCPVQRWCEYFKRNKRNV